MRERLARLIPGAGAWYRPGQDAEHEAAISAFLPASATLEAAELSVRGSTVEPAPDLVDAASATEREATTPAAKQALEPARAASSSTQLAPRPSLDDAPTRPPEALPNEGPAPKHRPRPGETAPDHLLRAPESVDAVTDGFLDALVRRIEDDR